MQIFFGEIDAAEFVIFVHVANDVRQLKGEAEFFREIEGPRVAETEDVGTSEADCAGYAIAIFAQTVEGRIPLDCQIHFGAADEVVKVARGHFVTLHGVDEGGEDFGSAAQRRRRRGHGRVAVENMILPGDVLIQSGAPFGEAALLRAEVHTFVHNVVHETHESVESGQGVTWTTLWTKV